MKNWRMENDEFKSLKDRPKIQNIKLICHYNELIVALTCDYNSLDLIQIENLFANYQEVDFYYDKENRRLCFTFFWDDFDRLFPIALNLFSQMEFIDDESKLEMIEQFKKNRFNFNYSKCNNESSNTTSVYSASPIDEYQSTENVNYSYEEIDNKKTYPPMSEDNEVQAAIALSLQTLDEDDNRCTTICKTEPFKIYEDPVAVTDYSNKLFHHQQLLYEEDEALEEAIKRSCQDQTTINLNTDDPKENDQLLNKRKVYPNSHFLYQQPNHLISFPNIEDNNLDRNTKFNKG